MISGFEHVLLFSVSLILFLARTELFCTQLTQLQYKEMGYDVIVGNPNSTSLRLCGTGKTEQNEKTQPFYQIKPRLVIAGLQFSVRRGTALLSGVEVETYAMLLSTKIVLEPLQKGNKNNGEHLSLKAGKLRPPSNESYLMVNNVLLASWPCSHHVVVDGVPKRVQDQNSTQIH